MLKFKQFINEGIDPTVKKKMIDHAHEIYQNAHPDLPRYGDYHFASAVDHVADRLSDAFHKEVGVGPHFNTIARQVVKQYEEDDTAHSRKLERKRAKKDPVIRVSDLDNPKKPKEPVARAPKIKPRRGIGSY